MSRSLFTNPKAALAFAGATLVGAVAMVGTSDQHGVLPAVVEQIEARSAGEVAASPAGLSPPPPAVFGDYGSGEPEVAQPPPADPLADASALPPEPDTEVIMSPTGEAIPVVRDDPAVAPR